MVRDLLAGSVPEAAQFLRRMSMSFSPILVDCRPILTSTASMLGECMPQYGDMSRAAHVCSRFAVGAAALAIMASRSPTCVRQWWRRRSQPMLPTEKEAVSTPDTADNTQ